LKLPSVQPLEENYLCRNMKEFVELMERTLAKGSGAFFKILGKVDGIPYYVTVLIDNQKIIAVEIQDVRGGSVLTGKPALQLLKEMITAGPVVVDAFPLDDVDIKMSIVDNLEVYNATPKMRLEDVCPSLREKSGEGIKRPPEKTESYEDRGHKAEEKAKPQPKRLTISLEVPANLEPYFRALANRIAKYSKSVGVEPRQITVKAKEVRYALGAGVGIHTTVEIEGSVNSKLPTGEIKKILEEFLYREAGELSKELGKRVVISNVLFRT